MKLIKEFLDIAFWSMAIVLGLIVCISIGTEAYKNIRISNKIKQNDVCIKINNELYCRLDYDITIKYNGSEI